MFYELFFPILISHVTYRILPQTLQRICLMLPDHHTELHPTIFKITHKILSEGKLLKLI